MASDYVSQLNRILDGDKEPGQVGQTLPCPNEINGSSTSVVSASTHSLSTSSSRSSSVSVASSQLPRQGGVVDSSAAITFHSSMNGLVGGEKTDVTAGGAATYGAGQTPSTEDADPTKLADCKTGQTPPHPVPEFLFQLTKVSCIWAMLSVSWSFFSYASPQQFDIFTLRHRCSPTTISSILSGKRQLFSCTIHRAWRRTYCPDISDIQTTQVL